MYYHICVCHVWINITCLAYLLKSVKIPIYRYTVSGLWECVRSNMTAEWRRWRNKRILRIWERQIEWSSDRMCCTAINEVVGSNPGWKQKKSKWWALKAFVYTLCLKKRPTFTTCYNFYIHSSITTIFGRNIAEKVGNQNVLYFPTTPN